MIALSLALCFSGFVALSLSMNRHHEQVFASKPGERRSRVLRLAGWLALGLAILPCIQAFSLSVGLALWVATLSVAAALLIVLLPYAPRMVTSLALLAPALSASFLLL